MEVYNDIDGGLVNFFRVLADPDLFPALLRRVDVLPWSRKLWEDVRAEYYDILKGDAPGVGLLGEGVGSTERRIELAWRWFVIARQSFGGKFGNSWGFSLTSNGKDISHETSRWMTILRELPWYHERIQRVQIECVDWRRCIELYDSPKTLFYLDPPYMHETRSSTRYSHELEDSDHVALIDICSKLQAMVMLSGYPNTLYDRLTDLGWDRTDFVTSAHSAGRTKKSKIHGPGSANLLQGRIECVWRNPVAMSVWKARRSVVATQEPLFNW